MLKKFSSWWVMKQAFEWINNTVKDCFQLAKNVGNLFLKIVWAEAKVEAESLI